MRGVVKPIRPAASRSGAAAAAISGEWKACETASGRTATPRSVSSSRTGPMSSAAPESTRWSGVLTAATATEAKPAATARTASGSPTHEIIAPSPGCSSMSRPRSTARVRASSKDNAPAAQAAPSAPTLWPSTAVGRTPRSVQSRARATSNATSAGWQSRVPRNASSCSGSKSRSSRGMPRWGRSTSRARSREAAKPGWASYRSLPMPVYWVPWPLKRNAMRGVGPVAALPRRTDGAGSSRISASRAVSKSAFEPAVSTARCGRWARPVLAARHRSATGTSGCAARWVRHERARVVRAVGVWADRHSACTARGFVTVRVSSRRGAGGASRTRWALAPPNPNELTAARAVPPADRARRRVGTARPEPSQSRR